MFSLMKPYFMEDTHSRQTLCGGLRKNILIVTWEYYLNPHTQLHFCINHDNFPDAFKIAFAQYTKYS